MRVSVNKDKQTYYLQLDIFNFFYSINKNILLAVLKAHFKIAVKNKQINEQRVHEYYELCQAILVKPKADNKLNKEQLNNIAEHKQLRKLKEHIGLPIGNLSSQFFANVYLHELDCFIKHTLKIKPYVRFVDDFVILHHDKEQLKSWQKQIEVFLKDKLDLRLKDEKILKPISSGVDFLGYITYPYHKLVRKRVVHNFYVKLKLWYEENTSIQNARVLFDLDSVNLNKLNALFFSYLGHIQHAKSYKIISNKFRQFPYLKLFFYLKDDKYQSTAYNKHASKFFHQRYFFNTIFKNFSILIQKGTCFLVSTYSIHDNKRYHIKEEFTLKKLDETFQNLQNDNQSYIYVSEQGFVHNALKQRKLRYIFISNHIHHNTKEYIC